MDTVPVCTDQHSNSSGAATNLQQWCAELARDAAADQLSELEGIRQRTVQFLAFVGSGAAFLVGSTLTNSDRGALFGWLCIGGALGVVLLLIVCMSIFTGSERWFLLSLVKNDHNKRRLRPALMDWDSGRVNPDRLLGVLADQENPSGPIGLYRDLINAASQQVKTNDRYLQALRHRYTGFLVLSMLVLLGWGVLAWLSGVMTNG